MSFIVQNFLSGLAMGGVYALVALGFYIMWSAARAANFAHGDPGNCQHPAQHHSVTVGEIGGAGGGPHDVETQCYQGVDPAYSQAAQEILYDERH